MGRHHSAFRESDAYLLHIEELVDEEIGTGIGQRRIADGWPDALVFLAKLLFDGKMFIGCIAPVSSFLTSSCSFSAVASASRSHRVCAIMLR